MSILPSTKPVHELSFTERLTPDERVLAILKIAIYKVTEPTDWPVKKTFGAWCHHSLVVEVEGNVFLRLGFNGPERYDDAHRVSQTVRTSSSLTPLVASSRRLAFLENRDHRNLKLSKLARILALTHSYTHSYHPCARNCI
jgi:hypothetical protein